MLTTLLKFLIDEIEYKLVDVFSTSTSKNDNLNKKVDLDVAISRKDDLFLMKCTVWYEDKNKTFSRKVFSAKIKLSEMNGLSCYDDIRLFVRSKVIPLFELKKAEQPLYDMEINLENLLK